LIDEMTEDVVRSGSGSIVMEMRGGLRGLKLAQYACTQRVFPVPTTQMNARRCVLKGAEQPATCVSSSANHNRDQTLILRRVSWNDEHDPFQAANCCRHACEGHCGTGYCALRGPVVDDRPLLTAL